MLEALEQTIRQHQLMPPHTTVILAISGGTDSLALMVAMAKIQPILKINLHLATFDHGWRGAAGAKDVEFVVSQAHKYHLPITTGQATLSLHNEAAARHARYNFLAQVAQQQNTSIIATAHQADDQAETVLMHLLRGTGLNGLTGMRHRAPVPDHPSLTLVRPMLNISREEILQFNRQESLTPRQDATNQDTNYLRNRIRLDLLPYLQTFNPNIRQALTRLADSTQHDADYLQQQVQQLLNPLHPTPQGKYHLKKHVFQSRHPALKRRLILEIIHKIDPNTDPNHGHITAAVELATSGTTGNIAQFPNHIQMKINYDTLIFEKTTINAQNHPVIAIPPHTQIPITISRPIPLLNGTLYFAQEPIGQVLGQVYLTDTNNLYLRTRHPGDRLTPPGMNGHSQKLKDWFINRKIPAHHRDYVPLMTQHETIIAVLHHTRGIVTHPFHLKTHTNLYFICYMYDASI